MKTEAQGSEPSCPRIHCDRDIGLVSEPSSSPLQDLPPSASARSPLQSKACGVGKAGWFWLQSCQAGCVRTYVWVGRERAGGDIKVRLSLCNVDSFLIVQEERILRDTK